MIWMLWGCGWPPGFQHEQHTVESAALSTQYTLNVLASGDYAAGDPVLFLLDGDEGAGLRESVGVVADLIEGGQAPAGILIVGIGYGDGENMRTRDYTPVPVDGAGGEAEAFFAFVADTVVPHVEEAYAPGSTRVLGGHSLGGLGALWALLHHSADFSGIISMSPAVMWGEQAIFGEEQDHAASGADLPVRLHLCVGSEESLGQTVGWQGMVEVLSSGAYPGLQLASAVAAGDSHIAARPVCLAEGVRHAFAE